MGAQVPFDGSFVVEANAPIEVSCELLAESCAVSEYEIVVDVGDYDKTDVLSVGNLGKYDRERRGAPGVSPDQ